MSATKIQEVQVQPDAKQARTLEGRVTSNKMDKTVTVLVERQVQHWLLGKIIRRSTKLHAQDDLGANEGDLVRIAECRPLSKTKHHRVVEIITRANA
jgi:small subunit ribosomal protein S17